MPHVANASGRRDVAESAVAVVFKELIAGADGGDVEIRVTIVIDVGKRGRHTDLACHRDAGGCRDVLESTAADVLPKLVAANLADKVDVRQTISIDIRDRHAIAMIVVSRFVGLAGVVDDAVPERDAAPGQLVCELKVVKRADTGSRLDLRVPEPLQPRRIPEIGGDEPDGSVACGRLLGRAGGLHRRVEEKNRCPSDTGRNGEAQHDFHSNGHRLNHALQPVKPKPSQYQLGPPSSAGLVSTGAPACYCSRYAPLRCSGLKPKPSERQFLISTPPINANPRRVR